MVSLDTKHLFSKFEHSVLMRLYDSLCANPYNSLKYNFFKIKLLFELKDFARADFETPTGRALLRANKYFTLVLDKFLYTLTETCKWAKRPSAHYQELIKNLPYFLMNSFKFWHSKPGALSNRDIRSTFFTFRTAVSSKPKSSGIVSRKWFVFVSIMIFGPLLAKRGWPN